MRGLPIEDGSLAGTPAPNAEAPYTDEKNTPVEYDSEAIAPPPVKPTWRERLASIRPRIRLILLALFGFGLFKWFFATPHFRHHGPEQDWNEWPVQVSTFYLRRRRRHDRRLTRLHQSLQITEHNLPAADVALPAGLQSLEIDLGSQNTELSTVYVRLAAQGENSLSNGWISVDGVEGVFQSQSSESFFKVDLATAGSGAHEIEVVLSPESFESSILPSLAVTGGAVDVVLPSGIDVVFSALDLELGSGSLRFENNESQDAVVAVFGEARIATINKDITGTFNISHGLILQSDTGSIDVKVAIQEPPKLPHKDLPPHGPHPPPHGPHGPHDGPGKHGDHKGKHGKHGKHHKHHKHDKHGKKDKKHGKHGKHHHKDDEDDDEEKSLFGIGMFDRRSMLSRWFGSPEFDRNVEERLFEKDIEAEADWLEKQPGGDKDGEDRPHPPPPPPHRGPRGPGGPHGPGGPGGPHGPPHHGPRVFVMAESYTGSVNVEYIEHPMMDLPPPPPHGPPHHPPPPPPHHRPGPPPPPPRGPPPPAPPAGALEGGKRGSNETHPHPPHRIPVPLDSHLRTRTGSVKVIHHPVYFGRFAAGSRVGTVELANDHEDVKDIVIDRERKGETGAFVGGYANLLKDSSRNETEVDTDAGNDDDEDVDQEAPLPIGMSDASFPYAVDRAFDDKPEPPHHPPPPHHRGPPPHGPRPPQGPPPPPHGPHHPSPPPPPRRRGPPFAGSSDAFTEVGSVSVHF